MEPIIRRLFETSAADGAHVSDGSNEAQMLVGAAKSIIISAYLKNPTFAYSDLTEGLTVAIKAFRKAIS